MSKPSYCWSCAEALSSTDWFPTTETRSTGLFMTATVTQRFLYCENQSCPRFGLLAVRSRVKPQENSK